jgi:hypothetical protein
MGMTLGHLVREAVDQSYQKKDVLEEHRDVAVRAYQEGLISRAVNEKKAAPLWEPP